MSDTQQQLANEMSRPNVADSNASQFMPQIQIEDALLEDITGWISGELYLAKARRTQLEDKLNMLVRTYEAEPEQARKSFPWDGACNLVVPVVATAVETVFTRVTGSLFGTHELYAGKARSAKWTEAADPTINWLNWVNDNVFDARRIYSRWVLSCLKTGTSIVKLPWVRRIREVRYMDSSGGNHTEEVVLHDGPRPEFVPLEDFFWSRDANSTQNLQDCEWVAHRFTQTWKQLKEAELSGDYIDVERIQNDKRTQFKDSETDIQEITGEQPQEPNDYELWEVWASYPISDDGKLAEIVITIHLETQTVIRAVYNFYRHQERPFHSLKFFPRENSFLGIGLAEMLVQIQEEVTAIHRNRLDNATLANAKVYKRTDGANVSFEDVFPGAILDVESQDDITNMDMGVEHSSLLMEEQHTIIIGEKRSGVSDYSAGRESSAIGSRATATSTMALIREGNKRFQFFISEVRKVLTDIGHQTISLYQQFAPNREVHYELFSEKESQWFQRLMTLPPELSRSNIVLDVRALDESNNKEIEQQAYMMMIKVVQETYMQIGQAMMLISNPEAPEPVKGLAQQGATTASKLLERLLETFGFRDAEQFSPNIEELLGMTAALEMGGSIANFIAPGGNPGTGGEELRPGMGNDNRGAGPQTQGPAPAPNRADDTAGRLSPGAASNA